MCQPLIPINASGWVHLIHRIVVGLSAISALWVLIKGWRVLRNETGSLVAATLVAMLFLAQIQLGALQVLRGFPTDLLWLHQAASAALWAAWVVLFALQLVSNRSQAEENNAAASPLDFGARIKDLVILSKPIIVLLLLVTTYTGMVVAGKTIPGLSITFWTMLGGALAAGGSGAVNQYIDREVDQRMTRTANRPIAAGRMTPAEGIAFGVGVLVVAFLILAGFVNLLSALLSLVGMLYYVVLYSLWLKHRSVQNIVIGGGAGAIPPLVGWAAVTGTLSLPAFFLFAIIFMWTPPHFWALALIRKNDYERAGIPMLPVIKGREETQRQVWIYTLELVALTLAMWVFQFAGLIYLVSALLLGGYLIYWAWRVFKDGSNKIAWSMYRYSSMYLALLFVALMIDAVLS
jgi:protoheme IX farnesyltransferase